MCVAYFFYATPRSAPSFVLCCCRDGLSLTGAAISMWANFKKLLGLLHAIPAYGLLVAGIIHPHAPSPYRFVI